jgi:uncharacterized protein with NRDE domain
MCLIMISYDMHPKYRLIMACNRDEYYNRLTLPLDFWNTSPDILAGKDLRGKGTWLGVTKSGRLSAITNYRDPSTLKDAAPSRGELITDFLKGETAPKTYMEHIKRVGHKYNGFNLIACDIRDCYFYSNMEQMIKKIKPGIYGVSNHLLDTPWPKVKKAKEAFKNIVTVNSIIDPETLFIALKDNTVPADEQLPDTGVGINWERRLSSIFIKSKTYGTRSSSIILYDRKGHITFVERTFIPSEGTDVQYSTKTFQFAIS